MSARTPSLVVRFATRSQRAATRLATSLVAALLLVVASGAAHAAVSAQLDRDTAALGEPVTLTIVSDGKASGAQPDLSPLRKDFDVLGSSQSSETRIVNFHRSDSVRWTVQLLPRRAGRIELPPLAVGAERTAALALDVGAPAAAPPTSGSAPGDREAAGAAAFIEVDAPAAAKPLYVQQPLLYTLRLYVDASVRSGDLLAPTSADAVVEQLGDERRSRATFNGHDYTVIERSYAITPDKSGDVQIAPATFRGQAVVARDPAQRSDPGDDMMAEMLRNTPFANLPMFRNRLLGGFAANTALRPVGASAAPLALSVLPRPAAASGAWLPAEQLTLRDSWAGAAPALVAGEPVKRTLTIEATGPTAAQIPPLAIAQPANARIYPEAPEIHSRSDGRAIHATVTQTVTYIPTAAGGIDIAPVSVAWWDTRDNVQRNAELAALHLQVAPGAAPAQANAQATHAPARAATPAPGATAAAPAAAPPDAADTAWYVRAANALREHPTLALAGLALLVAGFAVAGWWLLRTRSAADAPPKTAPTARASRNALEAACRAGRREDAARALLAWARAEWPERAPRGLAELADLLASGADEVRTLDRSLYGAGGTDWDGAALWRAIGSGLRSRQREVAARSGDGLAPLYP